MNILIIIIILSNIDNHILLVIWSCICVFIKQVKIIIKHRHIMPVFYYMIEIEGWEWQWRCHSPVVYILCQRELIPGQK